MCKQTKTDFSKAILTKQPPAKSNNNNGYQCEKKVETRKKEEEKLQEIAHTKTGVPTHNPGSIYNMKVPMETRHTLLETELSKLQKSPVENKNTRDNLVHQLMLIDAKTGKKPRDYLHEDKFRRENNSTPQNAILLYPDEKASKTKLPHDPNEPGKSEPLSDDDFAKKYVELLKGIPEINALGAGGGMIRADEREKKRRDGIDERYKKNKEIEDKNTDKENDAAKHINGQGLPPYDAMSFGPTIEEQFTSQEKRDKLNKTNQELSTEKFGTVANAGCESIAIYNALVDLGMNPSLSDIIRDTERNDQTLWNGWFGTKPWEIDDVLRSHGVESQKTDQNTIQQEADNGEIKDGQIYVISIKNDKDSGLAGFKGGVHTVEVVYSPSQNPDEPWVVRNINNGEPEEKTFASMEDILHHNKGNGGYSRFLPILKVTGKRS